jgi:putative PIN family toxin of toxin-antitoxin system
MKAVVDTNVLVSVLIKPSGIPAQLLKHPTPFTLVTSEEILAELERVLYYPRIRQRYSLSEELINGYLSTLRADSEVVQITQHVQGVSQDPDDDKFLACAASTQVDSLVSGDPHLTSLKRYQKTSILTPRQFLAILQAAQ